MIGIKFQGTAIMTLQEASEAYLINIFKDSNMCDTHIKMHHNAKGHSISLMYQGGEGIIQYNNISDISIYI